MQCFAADMPQHQLFLPVPPLSAARVNGDTTIATPADRWKPIVRARASQLFKPARSDIISPHTPDVLTPPLSGGRQKIGWHPGQLPDADAATARDCPRPRRGRALQPHNGSETSFSMSMTDT